MRHRRLPDGYAGYDKLYITNRVTEVACWAHFRRKIFDIHATKPTSLTTEGFPLSNDRYRRQQIVRFLERRKNYCRWASSGR